MAENESTTKAFKQNLKVHLSDQKMRRNVARNTWLSIVKREKAIAEVPEWEDYRTRVNQIKKNVIENLSDYLKEFENNARASGIEVCHAKTAAEANEIAHRIAQKHDVKRIVKSKSMMTEEIGFNAFMIGKGYEVVETDLGEFVVQLAGERPSNIISPIMHKNMADVARLFEEKLGISYREDPQYLTLKAREILRERFLNADMGISGVNFGIVENGAMVLVENEGNGRMCVSVPAVHVAIMGMEKLIPRLADLDIFLTLLCRSGTGQKLTSYVTLIKGPKMEPQLDGPQAVYYIIVDNGRSQFLEDEMLQQALYCIRCSACLNICPVYQNIGGHAYGWVYQGPIGSIITPQFLGLEQAAALPFASSLCGSCTDVCPVKIPLHHLLLYQRQRIVRTGLSPSFEKFAFRVFSRVMQKPSLFRWSVRLGRMLNSVFPMDRLLPAWSRQRTVPRMASTSFRQWWKNREVISND